MEEGHGEIGNCLISIMQMQPAIAGETANDAHLYPVILADAAQAQFILGWHGQDHALLGLR